VLQRIDTRRALRIVDVSFTGGRFAEQSSEIGLAPALQLGLIRCYAEEHSGVSAKHLDLEASIDDEALARLVVDELETSDASEVLYRQRERFAFMPTLTTPVRGTRSRFSPAPSWVWLASGGASGITKEALLALAVPGNTVILLGRTAYAPEACVELDAFPDRPSLTRHFLQRSAGPALDLVRSAEARAAEVIRVREVQDALRRFETRGVKAEYHSLDLRDGAAVRALLQDVRKRHGRVDALLHGAGILEDRRFASLDAASLERVLDTKLLGALQLCRELDPEELQVCVFFGSVAGRFGNAGQAAYGAANLGLSHLGPLLHEQWRGSGAAASSPRVLTVHWGPWSGTGMAQPTILSRLQARGIEPLGIYGGCKFLERELMFGQHSEVVAGAGPWQRALPVLGKSPSAPHNIHTLNGGRARAS
jgi:NAD(P)-dependent dehydrogenase (short-subunit alcohol dehydrogenase family)